MKKYIYLVLELFISALFVNIFLKKNNILVGFVPSLALIIFNKFKIKVEITIIIISIILILFSYLLLDKKCSNSALIGIIIYNIFLNITKNITLSINNLLIGSLFLGLVTGYLSYKVYLNGLTPNPFGVLVLIINKYLKKNIGLINLILNIMIIIISMFLITIKNIEYSILINIINGLIIGILLRKKDIYEK